MIPRILAGALDALGWGRCSTPGAPCTGSCGGHARISAIPRIPCTCSFGGYARICQKAFLLSVSRRLAPPFLADFCRARTDHCTAQHGLLERVAAAQRGLPLRPFKAGPTSAEASTLTPGHPTVVPSQAGSRNKTSASPHDQGSASAADCTLPVRHYAYDRVIVVVLGNLSTEQRNGWRYTTVTDPLHR